MVRTSEPAFLLRMPLFLLICLIAAVSMWLPASHALTLDNHPASQSFFYAGTAGVVIVVLIALALASRPSRYSPMSQLLALFATFLVLPVYLAVPIHDLWGSVPFFDVYFDMVSALTTTGAPIFDDPNAQISTIHLWRAQVAWMGGLLMWIAASAILAPLSLGGFEITRQSDPGRDVSRGEVTRRADPRRRLARIALTLAPLYAGLTVAIWVLLLIAGEDNLVALCHAMSVMSTSGISPVGGLDSAQAGLLGEAILFLFLFFALSRLTFSRDTAVRGDTRFDKDPEFRIGLLIVLVIPILLFARHWAGALDEAVAEDLPTAGRALWGGLFTVLSFLSTTGFESAHWSTAQAWSGLETPGIILMGLALIGGGVATTAGGVKLLRVFALYLTGLNEMQKLVHPSVVIGDTKANRRLRPDGAFIAWVFFMLFALSLATISVMLSAAGISFDNALILTIAALSTTGPLIASAADMPVELIMLTPFAKSVLIAAMVLGRLETLAIIALLTLSIWRQ